MSFVNSYIYLEKPIFFDLPPEEKTPQELIIFILKDALGKKVDLKKYNDREISICVRKLILDGFLRGTIRGFYDCSWSKLTRRGQYLLNVLENNLGGNNF